MTSSAKPASRTILLAALLVGAGFVYGFASAKKRFFPHAWITAVFSSREVPPAGAGQIETVMDTGWWVADSRLTEDDVTRDLDKLGYGQTYEAAGDRFGVVLYDEDRVEDGWNLIVSAHEPEVLLADMNGDPIHAWRFAFENVPTPDDFVPTETFGTRYFRRAALLPNGELLALYDRTGLIKLDRDSELIWSLVGGYHHDLDVAPDGSIWVLTNEIHAMPRIHESASIVEDFITHVSAAGTVIERFSLLEAFENSDYAALLANIRPEKRGGDIFHTNTLEVFDGELAHLSPFFAKGMALISVWGLDTVAIVDLAKVEVVWALSGMWHRQHEPVILENGNLLVFDNMGHDETSTVIELEPFTQRVVWSYEGDEENDFYSALCGSCQRLPNGNTLITESLSGRAFEVAPNGDVVWRYLSPFRAGEKLGREGVAVLMEVIRLDRDLPLDWLEPAGE